MISLLEFILILEVILISSTQGKVNSVQLSSNSIAPEDQKN